MKGKGKEKEKGKERNNGRENRKKEEEKVREYFFLCWRQDLIHSKKTTGRLTLIEGAIS